MARSQELERNRIARLSVEERILMALGLRERFAGIGPSARANHADADAAGCGILTPPAGYRLQTCARQRGRRIRRAAAAAAKPASAISQVEGSGTTAATPTGPKAGSLPENS